MPSYDYLCKCGHLTEIMHAMSDETERACPECGEVMNKQIGIGYLATSGFKPTLADLRETDHHKKVKDKDRAVKMRKREFGHDAVGDPVDKPDARHIVKKGRTIGGQQMEVDKKDFVKAAAQDPAMVRIAQDALKKEK
jgi:putative FmdB family regulatory protein